MGGKTPTNRNKKTATPESGGSRDCGCKTTALSFTAVGYVNQVVREVRVAMATRALRGKMEASHTPIH